MSNFDNLPALPSDGTTHFFREGNLVVNGHNKRVVLENKKRAGDYGQCVCCHGWDNDWAILCESCYEHHLDEPCSLREEQAQP